MSKQKTDFELEFGPGDERAGSYGTIKIIGSQPDNAPYLAIYIGRKNGVSISGWVKDKDLERLARNILKALGK